MAAHDITTRACTSCSVAKPFADFNKKKGGKHGLQPVCRACQKVDQKSRREANPDLHKERCAKWYAERVWREKNPELANKLIDEYINRTTKICSRCSENKPLTDFNKARESDDGLQYKCRACQKELKRQWYLRNREREIQKSTDWAKNNPEKAREKDRRRAIAHPGRTTSHSRNWRARNPERSDALSRAWKKANPDKVRASARSLYAKDPSKNLAKSHARRIRSPITGTIFTKSDIDRIYVLQKGKCACCKVRLGEKFERDHVIPLAKGGTNDHLNIQLLCRPCNKTKSAKHPIDFMQEKGFLL